MTTELIERVSCKEILEKFRTELEKFSSEPEEGWLSYAYKVANSLSYPQSVQVEPSPARSGALYFLQMLRETFEHEREEFPKNFWLDFDFCSEEEIAQSQIQSQYKNFLKYFRDEYIYEMMRLGREVTPFRSLEHIAGVHNLAMTVARNFRKNGGLVDLALMSSAAAGHDFGKFGCRKDERVPYLHYFYTDKWFTSHNLSQIGLIASNHSVWDLEIENLSAESLILVYADFRVKQERTPDGKEIPKLFSLKEAFDVILQKLDNVDARKKLRYEHVYAKLKDFEEYLNSLGVEIEQHAALMNFEQVERAISHTAVEHNLQLMHRLTANRLFASTLEEARSEKRPACIRAYVAVFEAYFTYLNVEQKEQVLAYLYELLLSRDDDVRLQAAKLIGRIIAKFLSGYKKEIPKDAPLNPLDNRPFELWEIYLDKIISPNKYLTTRQKNFIRCQAKIVAQILLEECSPSETARFMEILLGRYKNFVGDEDTAFILMDVALNIPISADEILLNFAKNQLSSQKDYCKVAAQRLICKLEGKIFEPIDFAPNKIFSDNLKSGTHWSLKVVGIEYLLALNQSPLEQIAVHFANLIKSGSNSEVRRKAGAALLKIAPNLSVENRNEIAIELVKTLENGEIEIAQYIPGYLGQFVLWLPPAELDEILNQIQKLCISSNDNVAASAIATAGSIAEHYFVYGLRFQNENEKERWRKIFGFILKGLAADRHALRQESLRVLGECIFSSDFLTFAQKGEIFTFAAKKILCLLQEQVESGLAFFYTSAALYNIYKFIIQWRVQGKKIIAKENKGVAFFPGSFDPFSLSHKEIATTIRNLGFEVYLAVDEFSWSKNTQPTLYRRKIIGLSVADEYDIYLFPKNFPVNIANPDDIKRLIDAFGGREVFFTVGADVISNASAYRAAPTPYSVHVINHIVFHRDVLGNEPPDLSAITGKIIRLSLPPQFEDISSTQIRENIDSGQDTDNLLDSAAQEYILANSLYLREPRYKKIIGSSDFVFSFQGDELILKNRSEKILGTIRFKEISSNDLFGVFHDTDISHYVRTHTCGKILLLTGMETSSLNAAQLLLSEIFSHGMSKNCSYACWYADEATPAQIDLLHRQGFFSAELKTPKPILLCDMRSPSILLQNILTVLKEPFVSMDSVRKVVQAAHHKFQHAVCALFPKNLTLSLDAEVTHHRLADKMTALNNVPSYPTSPRVLGEKMCVPFGKFLKGSVVPNTVTHTIYADEVFTPDLKSFRIEALLGYAPLDAQIRSVRSFRRKIVLIDDVLHTGNRILALDELFRKENVAIENILVGVLSGRGNDLMSARGLKVDDIYCVPDMRFWFMESAMYPFLGGDSISGEKNRLGGATSAVNLILPYAQPEIFKECPQDAVFNFSKTCIENSRDIFLALEDAFRQIYSRNLTLKNLSEVLINPTIPDKGNSVRYNGNRFASTCLEEDLILLSRIGGF